VDAHAFSQQAQEIQTNTVEQKKMMATVFWERKGILLTEFMAQGPQKRQRFIVKR